MMLSFFALLQVYILLNEGVATSFDHYQFHGLRRPHGHCFHNHGHFGQHGGPHGHFFNHHNHFRSSYGRRYQGFMSWPFSIRGQLPNTPVNPGEKAKLIDLKPGVPGDTEYATVKELMEKTALGVQFNIIKIQKVVNSFLWDRYLYRQQDVVREAKVTNEKMLWHGSPAALELVEKGFDERYAHQGGMFGSGLYFAEHSAKSHKFTVLQADGTRLMLLCRVTLGNMFVTHAAKNFPHAPIGYHSVKGAIRKPEYVVYRGEQAYPEYLITYK